MKDYFKRLERNIPVGYIYNFFMFFRLTNAVWVIYLGIKGMSLVEIGLLESIFHIASFVFEVPTGALADIFGRKVSLVLGRIASIVSAVLMIYSSSFWGFAVSFVFSGLSYTLNSGAAESLVYDSIKQLDREGEYKKLSGKINFLIEISMATSVILGGWLSDISYIYAYIAMIIVDIFTIIPAIEFEEPKIRSVDEERIGFVRQITQSILVLKDKAGIVYMMLYFSTLSTVCANMYFYSQQYFSSCGYQNKYIAIIYTAEGLVSALMSKWAYRIEKKVKKAGVFFILPLIYIIGLLGVSRGSGYTVIAFFIVCMSLEGFSYPIASDYINSAIPSEYRATILSMFSTTYSIIMIVVFPLVGLLGQTVGLRTAYLYVALAIIPIIAVILFMLKKHKQY